MLHFYKHSPTHSICNEYRTIYIERHTKKRWAKKERNLPVAINKTWNEHLIQWNWYNETKPSWKDRSKKATMNNAISNRAIQSRTQPSSRATTKRIWMSFQLPAYGNETFCLIRTLMYAKRKTIEQFTLSDSWCFSGHFISKRLIKIRQNLFAFKGSSYHYQICSFSFVWMISSAMHQHLETIPNCDHLQFDSNLIVLSSSISHSQTHSHFAFNILYFLLDFVFLFGPALYLDCENWVSPSPFTFIPFAYYFVSKKIY